MNLLDTGRSALRSLRANKLRSLLTALGIIIGVAAVIAMLAVGEGAKRTVAEQLRSLGTNLMMVMPGTVTSSGVRISAWGRNTLTEPPRRRCAAPGRSSTATSTGPARSTASPQTFWSRANGA